MFMININNIKTKRILSAVLLTAIILSYTALTSCVITVSSGKTQSTTEADSDAIDTYLNVDIPDNNNDKKYTAYDTWAVYWYLCGSDLETNYGYATNDLYELIQVELPDNAVVVIETGGSAEWRNDIVDSATINRYLAAGDGLYLLETLPSRNMGDRETFRDFLSFCNKNYPADHQVVILWNHGAGSIVGVAFDELYGYDSLSLDEMRYAFDSVFELSEINQPIELIGFDACLMATVDTAYTFRDIAKYMVASQETEPGLGWNYQGFLQAFSDNPNNSGDSNNSVLNGAALGKVICDTYAEDCTAYFQGMEITMSVIDLSRISPLITAYNNVGIEALAAACQNANILTYFGRSADSSEKYGPNSRSEGGYTNMVDLGDLVKNAALYLPNTAQIIEDALDYCVIYKISGLYRSQSSGLSCYYPYDMDVNALNTYKTIAAGLSYTYLYEYIIYGEISPEGLNYVKSMSYGIMPDSPDIPDIPDIIGSIKPGAVPTFDNIDFNLEDYPVYIDGDGYAVLDLGSEIADILTGVYFTLVYYDEDYNLVIWLGRDNDIYSDWENGVFKDNFRGVWGAIDGLPVYMELTYDCEDYNLYSVPIILNGEECYLRTCYDFRTGEWEILGAKRGLDENGMSDKNLISLNPGDVITALHYVSFLDENLNINVDEITQIEIDTITVTENTSFGETDLGDGIFILLYEMADVRNNSMYSETVLITIEDGAIYMG